MPLRIDPEQNEVRALKRVGDWRGLRVLEIGCGAGRLTQRLAGLGAQVHAVDSDSKLIRAARKDLPQQFVGRVRFQVGSAEKLQQPDNTFDRVVFAWVL